MTRNLRQDPAEGWHHVTNHAVGSEDLFVNDQDRHQFIRRMGEASEKYNVAVIAFCLMGNHFHLVLYCPERGVSKFMHYLESIYAREFTMRHGRRGKLYECEFGNTIIADDGQAMATIRYVHRNPLELGLDIRRYPWSSYLAYVNGNETFVTPQKSIVDNLLGGPEAHRSYVETDFDSDDTSIAHARRVVLHAPPFDHRTWDLRVVRACFDPLLRHCRGSGCTESNGPQRRPESCHADRVRESIGLR